MTFSFADFSFWCYECDSYVIHESLKHHSKDIPNGFYSQKFGEIDDGKVLEKILESRH